MEGNDLIGSDFGNVQIVDEMYNLYKKDPSLVDRSWAKAFEKLDRQPLTSPQFHTPISDSRHENLRIENLIEAYRRYGHLNAKINPIFEKDENFDHLELSQFGFSEEDLQKKFPTLGLLPDSEATLEEIINTLKKIYCSSVGAEYIGLERPDMEKWIQKQIEPNGFKIGLTIDQKKMILDHLNKSELLELFLQTKYTGQKRFSLEGGETLIPMLAAVIDRGAEKNVAEFILGMAHRGRLNVLSNILNKSYGIIFSEFDENYIPESFEQSGDVKYHKGFFSETTSFHGHKVQITLTPNPSHLEAVDPVVEGQAYVKQMDGEGQDPQKVIPILIHGDAALAGQGIVYETLQMNGLKGYGTGGTIHIVINNQIGFTTVPEDSRSTRYCTDIAHAFGIPIFHVNVEDPEACVSVAYLAVEIRQKFNCDVFIDMICYRKYGHNETDEPAYTQPHEYQIISKKKSVREIYRDELIQQGILEKKLSEELESEFKNDLQKELSMLANLPKRTLEPSADKNPDEIFIFQHIQTGVGLALLQKIATSACTVPEGFTPHPKLAKLLKDRLAMVQEGGKGRPVDWGMGEMLALGSLLWDGIHVRLSGQDSCRGTFSHRHAMWMDQSREQPYYPLKHLKKGQGRFDVFNSLLSEYAVLGFEYGYSIANPNALVIWEAQFGDFCNGAQLIIDQFISTGEQKWGQQIGLVLLLPHGYEGQGPEHSSARIERFLTLCGQNNLQVVNPSTPVQLFHLLRRQILSPLKKPLIVFTPKALLRHPECDSGINEFTMGSFQEVLDDPNPPKDVGRLIACSGHIYYDLIAERAKSEVKDMAIIRIEQLYPLNKERLKDLIKKYNNIKSFSWVQEEPRNMGAGPHLHKMLSDLLPKEVTFNYIARPRSASPAAGSYLLHKKELNEIMKSVFGGKQPSIFDLAAKT